MKLKYVLLIFIFLIIGLGITYFGLNKPSRNENIIVPVIVNNIPTNANVSKSTSIQTSTQQPKTVSIEPKAVNVASAVTQSNWINDVTKAIAPQAPNLNQNVLRLSLTAYENAQKKGVTNNSLIAIVDYSKPSSERRLWVVDVKNKKVLFNTWVAHGKNSGNVISTSFSNKPESLKSSLGVFVTSEIYSGKHGNSLRVQGLESGFNDNAYSRSIVFHGANYVSQSIAKTGRLGRSWGCWAVSEDIIASLIKTIKNKALVFAYYPDPKWLSKSTFLN